MSDKEDEIKIKFKPRKKPIRRRQESDESDSDDEGGSFL